MAEDCACSRVLCKRLAEVEEHNADLRRALEEAPYPSDLGCAEADRDLHRRRLTQLRADLEKEIADCRDIADDHRWAPEIRSARSSAARRLQAILDKSSEGGEG